MRIINDELLIMIPPFHFQAIVRLHCRVCTWFHGNISSQIFLRTLGTPTKDQSFCPAQIPYIKPFYYQKSKHHHPSHIFSPNFNPVFPSMRAAEPPRHPKPQSRFRSPSRDLVKVLTCNTTPTTPPRYRTVVAHVDSCTGVIFMLGSRYIRCSFVRWCVRVCFSTAACCARVLVGGRCVRRRVEIFLLGRHGNSINTQKRMKILL
jgi:hypothetical protein